MSTAVSKIVVKIWDQSYEVKGMDVQWHNVYRGPNSDFSILRKWFDKDVDWMLLKAASHIEMGLYRIVSISASKHSFVVVCICEKMMADFPDGWMVG